MKIVRIFTGDDGESHFEDLEVELGPDQYGGQFSTPVAAKSVIFRETGADYNLDYHTAPRRQYVVNLRGSVEIETGREGESGTLPNRTMPLAHGSLGGSWVESSRRGLRSSVRAIARAP